VLPALSVRRRGVPPWYADQMVLPSIAACTDASSGFCASATNLLPVAGRRIDGTPAGPLPWVTVWSPWFVMLLEDMSVTQGRRSRGIGS
jgi:hypothetical protein